MGCTLRCSRVNLLQYAGNLVLVVPTAQALNFFLKAFTSKLHTLSLQLNVLKSYNKVFRRINKKESTSLTINNQPPSQVMETTNLGVVLIKNVLLHLFRLHAMLFYGA